MNNILDPIKVAEIATFFARCWSKEPRVSVAFNPSRRNTKQVIHILPLEALGGTPLDRYRQMRANVWLASIKRRLGSRELSSDHAFGFVLNLLEIRRAELVGLEEWRGMSREIIFNYAFQWMYRPLLNSVYGRPRMAEAFLQHFMFDSIKGDITEGQIQSVTRAGNIAKLAITDAINGKESALDDAVPQILSDLELDPIVTVPIVFPWSRPDMPLNQDDLKKSITRIEGAMGIPRGQSRADEADTSVRGEYESLQGKSTGISVQMHDGISVPSHENVDETAIYDYELIARLKTKFRDWKSKWIEVRASSGAELDVESYIESSANVFVSDSRAKPSADVMMLLDHSSSIATVQTQYKKAALALCEVLSRLGVRFSVYAFSTLAKSVVCWEIKRVSQRWDVVCSKRLAQIAANGSTPLAQVYSTMAPVVDSERPKTFLTMTDGEPSDALAVRQFVMNMRRAGTRMAALGLGSDVPRATAIADNLKGLGYERVLAVSRLGDIPRKVLGVLGE